MSALDGDELVLAVDAPDLLGDRHALAVDLRRPADGRPAVAEADVADAGGAGDLVQLAPRLRGRPREDGVEQVGTRLRRLGDELLRALPEAVDGLRREVAAGRSPVATAHGLRVGAEHRAHLAVGRLGGGGEALAAAAGRPRRGQDRHAGWQE